jgi:hypothetical protein
VQSNASVARQLMRQRRLQRTVPFRSYVACVARQPMLDTHRRMQTHHLHSHRVRLQRYERPNRLRTRQQSL